MIQKKKILIIEDDDLQYEIYEEALCQYELIRARLASGALAAMAKERPHLIILDHILDQGERGVDFLAQFKDLLSFVPVIVVSGAMGPSEQMAVLQGPRRAHYFLNKPVDLDKLAKIVQTALQECGETEIIRQFQALEHSKRSDIEDLLSRSTDRLSRQTQIRQLLLETPQRPSIAEMARRFRVARRTIRRDLSELIRREELPPEFLVSEESADSP
jgi:DNA-binding NtrC family response regulator